VNVGLEESHLGVNSTVKKDGLRAAIRSHDILFWKEIYNWINNVEFCQRKGCNCDLNVYFLFKTFSLQHSKQVFSNGFPATVLVLFIDLRRRGWIHSILSRMFFQNSPLGSKVQSQPFFQVIWHPVKKCVQCIRFGVFVITSYGSTSSYIFIAISLVLHAVSAIAETFIVSWAEPSSAMLIEVRVLRYQPSCHNYF
jgi:hypothetical protein